MRKFHIVYIVNIDWFFLSHRLPLAIHAIKRGYKVTLLTKVTNKKEEIARHGIDVISLPIERSGTNIINELKLIYQIYKILLKLKPRICHNVTIKPSIYGSIACRLTNTFSINALSGLGYNFTDSRRGIVQKILIILMSFGFKSNKAKFIFQNMDDFEFLRNLNLVSNKNSIIVKGSGIDLNDFHFTPLPNTGVTSILMASRILYDKGVIEYLTAAKKLYEKHFGKVKFILAGDIDNENPASIPLNEIEPFLIAEHIEYIGFQSNIKTLIQQSHIIVLPSYREGLPKFLIEACAIGRPIVTTDATGCKDCVIENYNGFKVPIKNAEMLSESIGKLINDPALQTSMGKNARLLAEKEFSIQKVIEETFNLYE